MKIVGKLGEEKTVLDKTTLYGNLNYFYNKNKIESKGGFSSIRANNCLFRKKWCYEIQLITNKLVQIGWSQLLTPFTDHNGVGDDNTSYAYDGYRVVKWHSGKEDYGQIWDCGDVIGCCIDLDNKVMEFYQNGVSLGICFNNIPTGENIAYFPGLSLSADEKITFNFGKLPFHYSYPGYEPLDIPDSIINGSVEITAELIDLLKNSFMAILSMDEINYYHKLSLTNKLFNFLANVAFKDLFIFKTLLLPFLFELSQKKENEFKLFFEHLFIYLADHKEKLDLAEFLFDNICHMIEENSLLGEIGIEDWKNLIKLFVSIIHIDSMIDLWIESNQYIKQIKCLFNSNIVKMADIYEVLKNKSNDFSLDISVNTIFKEIKDEFFMKKMNNYEKLEDIYSEGLKRVIFIFLSDERSFKNNAGNGTKISLRSMLSDHVNKGYEFNPFSEILIGMNFNKKDFTPFYKNFVFNLFRILKGYMSNENLLDVFTIENWFNRLNQESLYYDEVGIGGTINHVTTEYIKYIDEDLRKGSNLFPSDLNHRIIKLISGVFLPVLREFSKILNKSKHITIKNFSNLENGTDSLDKLFRTYFYVFNPENQSLLYIYCFFLIKWINSMIRKNKHVVYFIPKSVLEIPFEIYKFLYKIKSEVIFNDEIRKNINKTSILFKDDNLVYEIVYFYTYLFNDLQIANPEIKESLISKIKFFMKKKETGKLYEEYYELIEFLIKGLLNYMAVESLSHISCEIIVKIIKPSCFGQKTVNFEKGTLVLVTQKFFENNVKSFHEFMDNYSKLFNKVMTDYTINLNEASNVNLNIFNFLENFRSNKPTFRINRK